MTNNKLIIATLLSALVSPSLAFTSSPTFVLSKTRSSTMASEKLHAVDPTYFSDGLATANSLWVSTIDSDIANIPTDQFGLIFAGGIAVMIGGVLSALIVGALLEKGDLYASLAAESYIQSADDEEFWKSLSEEEQVKAREMLGKIKASKNSGSLPGGETSTGAESVALKASSKTSEPKKVDEPPKQSQPADMFSDYGD